MENPVRLQSMGRSPHGERGLKYIGNQWEGVEAKSLPPRGAWIEIEKFGKKSSEISSRSPHGERGLKYLCRQNHNPYTKSLPPRGAWIEIVNIVNPPCTAKSLPPRGAWIEILYAREKMRIGSHYYLVIILNIAYII